MAKTLIIRKPVASLESSLMNPELYAEQVADQSVESQNISQESDLEMEETESTVASLESRIEQLELISGFANTPIHSFEQAQLTTALAFSAVEGTDLNIHSDVFGKTPDQFNASFESSDGLTFSAEAIGSTLKDMGKAAFEKLKQAGRWLLELATKVINLFKNKEGRIKNLKAMIEKAASESKLESGQTIRLTGAQANNIGTVEEFATLTSMFSALKSDSGQYKDTLDRAKDLIDNYTKPGLFENYRKAIMNIFSFYGDTFQLKNTMPDDGTVGEEIGRTEFVGRKQLVFKMSATLAPGVVESDITETQTNDHLIRTFNMVIETAGKDKDKELEAKVLTVDELKTLVKSLEESITGKMLDLTEIKKLTGHALFKLPGMGDSEHSRELRAVLMSVNRLIIQPQGMFLSTFQSVADDYLRFAERSAKAHINGKAVESNTQVAVV